MSKFLCKYSSDNEIDVNTLFLASKLQKLYTSAPEGLAQLSAKLLSLIDNIGIEYIDFSRLFIEVINKTQSDQFCYEFLDKFKSYINIEYVNKHDANNRPIMYIIQESLLETLRAAVETFGADINSKNIDELTPEMFAASDEIAGYIQDYKEFQKLTVTQIHENDAHVIHSENQALKNEILKLKKQLMEKESMKDDDEDYERSYRHKRTRVVDVME